MESIDKNPILFPNLKHLKFIIRAINHRIINVTHLKMERLILNRVNRDQDLGY